MKLKKISKIYLSARSSIYLSIFESSKLFHIFILSGSFQKMSKKHFQKAIDNYYFDIKKRIKKFHLPSSFRNIRHLYRVQAMIVATEI